MRILRVNFRSGVELLSSLKADPAPGSLFCPTTSKCEDGDPVLVECTVPDLPNAVVLRGVVRTWRPALPRRRIRAGATVDFDHSEEDKVTFIRQTLGGERPKPPRRRHTRLPVELPVRYRTPDVAEFTQSGITDISAGGALLRTAPEKPLPIGTEVILELLPPGAVSPLSIAARVAYDAGKQGAGLRFLARDAGGSRRLREIIRRITEA